MTTKSKPKLTMEQEAIWRLYGAWVDLKNMGWKDPRHFQFPDSDTVFLLIEAGSCGIHRAVRRNGVCWVDHQWPSTPILVREVPKNG
jgi:hypothetical protein